MKQRKWWKVLLFTSMLMLMFSTSTWAAGKKVISMQKKSSNSSQTLFANTQNWGDYSTEAYHKFWIPKSGRLEVSALTNYGGGVNVTLCNNKFQTVESTSSGTYVKDGVTHAYYGVKKGTYYLRVRNQKYYAVAAQFTVMADKGGSSKGKAYSLSRNKQYNGVMPAGEDYKTCDWYKFNVTSSKKINLNFKVLGHGKFSFYLFGPGYNGSRIKSTINSSWTTSLYRQSTYGSTTGVKKGTYYIKIMRTGENRYKRSSCGYWLKWNYA